MNISFSHYSLSNLLDETGDDYTMIEYFFKSNEEVCKMPIISNYDDLLFFIQKKDPPAYQYLINIRANISGYGPKHSKIFQTIANEGFNIEKYIYAFANEIDRNIIESNVKNNKNLSTNEIEQAGKAFEKLNALVTPEYINENIKIDQFTDAIDEKLHELTLKFFPEFFDYEPEYLKAYKSLLINTTLSFRRGVDKLRHRKL